MGQQSDLAHCTQCHSYYSRQISMDFAQMANHPSRNRKTPYNRHKYFHFRQSFRQNRLTRPNEKIYYLFHTIHIDRKSGFMSKWARCSGEEFLQHGFRRWKQMYSVVLMAALTTSAGPQDCHFGHGGYGCYSNCGCYGGGYGGGGYGGYGCYGCYGGGWGGGYGGGGYGGGYGGCYGCYGGGWGGWAGAYGGGYGCYGCYGGWGSYGPNVVPYGPGPGGPGPGDSGPKPDKDKDKDKDKSKGKNGIEEVRAKLTVELPADAQLYVDNVLMKTTSAKRSFVTPPLQPGKSYFYTLKAEMVRDGQNVSVTGKVVIQPGQDVQATLSEPTANGTFVVKTNPQ
jgi:uncharacterized protein (TIGR03000 family)